MKEKKVKNENIKLRKGKALLICGPQGSGKNLLAESVAKKHGTYKTVRAGALVNQSELASMFTDNPITVIVEEFVPTEKSLESIRPLIANDSVIVRQRGKSPMVANTPNFIFVTGDKDALRLGVDERRFMVVSTDGRGRATQDAVAEVEAESSKGKE